MAWTHYRAIADRFHHIDGEFVTAVSTLTPAGGRAEVVVRFYPWWEHPLYLAAVQRGQPWGFTAYDAGKRDVRVRAIDPFVVRLSPRLEVVDWRFEEQHPLLWSLANSQTLYVNGPFERSALVDGLMALALPNVSRADLLNHIDFPPADTAPLGIGVPLPLVDSVVTVLGRLGVPVFQPERVALAAVGVVFLMDDNDYVIARDFEVDLPEFAHDPQWFRPEFR